MTTRPSTFSTSSASARPTAMRTSARDAGRAFARRHGRGREPVNRRRPPRAHARTRRATYRNGYRPRRWDTRAGTIDLGHPVAAPGLLPTRLPGATLALRAGAGHRHPAGLCGGVSARRVEDLVRALGCSSSSRTPTRASRTSSAPSSAAPARQRCRTHFMTSLLTKVPKSAQSMVATVVRSIF